MSRIEKLSIQGVRSFGPHIRETIAFNTPLTLIVGYNGSGKTTIIECLKYATTGDLPPNSKGGAFIHDPNLCGDKEVLAQVKLSFCSTGGARFVVTRNLQLLVKKSSRQQKTLEASLRWNSNGERTVVSSKVADLGELVPRELGVSQAILDAVIFCHQEESAWPMSEPSVLKKRFDEIFEAMRYTKAIDNIKVLRKKQGEKLAQFKLSEEHDRVNKEKADRTGARMLTLQSEIDEHKKQFKIFTEQMEDFKNEAKKRREESNSFHSILLDLHNKTDQLKFRQDAADELKSTIEIMDESDAWLENTLAQYQEMADKLDDQINEKKELYHNAQGELGSTRKSLQGKAAEEGKHQSDKDNYERQVSRRIELVREAARLHSIRGFDGDITDTEVREFTQRLNKLHDEKKRELESVRAENAEELEGHAAAITELENKRASQTQNRVSAHNRISQIDKKVNGLLTTIKELNVDENAVSLLGMEYEGIDAKMQEETKRLEESKWDEQLEEETSRLRQLESESESLSNELVECTRLASERAQLDLRKKEQIGRRKKLEMLTDTWREKLSRHVEGEWSPASLDKSFLAVVNAHERILEDARRRRDAANRDVEQIEFKLSTARKERSQKSSEATVAKKRVHDALAEVTETPDVEAYEQEVESLRQELQGFEKDLALFGALDKYYTQCSQTLERQNKCKLCDRSFQDAPEVKTKLRQRLQKLLNPEQKAEVQADIDTTRPMLEALVAVQQHYETYRRLSAEMPSLDAEIKKLEGDRTTSIEHLEGKDVKVKDAEDGQHDLQALNKTAISIAQLARDIQDVQDQIARLESQQRSFASSRSADEIHELQTGLAEQIRSLKQKIDRLSKDRQRSREAISSLEREKLELRNKMSNAERQLERKQDLEGQIQSLKEDRSGQQDSIQQADAALKTLEPQIARARTERNQVLEQTKTKENRLAAERDELAASSSELRKVDRDIQDYIDRGGEAALASCRRAIQSLEQSVEQLEKEVSNAIKQINRLRDERNNSDRRRKNIADNLNYRKNLRILDELRVEIEDLESRNANEDYERLQGEARWFDDQETKALGERSAIAGTAATKDEELRRLSEEWGLEYEDADTRYRESHIKVETTKAAIEDLGKFAAALDKAVMEYHKRKMEDVNRIAADLWQKTYQGTDIDTILIRSDSESATGRRSYNYRVCMVKQDTEMDMRGRCSAGQKVLASIIIRLALAESFGVNCGLIALDEPTTNLDSDNIRSLAQSLHTIIESRRGQNNFQLIVITHDEEFLRYMRCGDFCDTYFRVSRNERQCSIIGVDSISKLSK